jgi:hypothetical protein
MQSIRILERKAEMARGDSNDNTALSRAMPQYAGVHADYRRDDYIFPRTQSLEMRELSWEERLPRIGHWGSNFVANLAFDIFA